MGNRRMSLVNPVLVMIANVDARVAREIANLERVKTKPQKHPKMILNFDATFAKASNVVAAVVMMTAPENQRMSLVHLRMSPVSQRMSLVNLVMIARIAENVKHVVILKTQMTQQLLQFLFDDYFDEKKQNELMTQPRSLVTKPENLAMVMIANADAKVARVVANHEKVTIPRLKHQKMFLHLDVLLNEMKNANVERALTRQFRTD